MGSDCFAKCGQHFAENPVAISLRGLSGSVFLKIFSLWKKLCGVLGAEPLRLCFFAKENIVNVVIKRGLCYNF